MKTINSDKSKVSNAITLIDKYNLSSRSRKRELVGMRSYIMFKLRSLGLSLEAIGKLFDRDHSTVIHAIKKHRTYTQVGDVIYRTDIAQIKHDFIAMNKNIQSSIFDDVLSANDYTDLLVIKQKIHSGVYLT
jgi:hypothetical protein